jgi:hypothetical protein
MRVIDMECSVPKRATAEGNAPTAGAPAPHQLTDQTPLI